MVVNTHCSNAHCRRCVVNAVEDMWQLMGCLCDDVHTAAHHAITHEEPGRCAGANWHGRQARGHASGGAVLAGSLNAAKHGRHAVCVGSLDDWRSHLEVADNGQH